MPHRYFRPYDIPFNLYHRETLRSNKQKSGEETIAPMSQSEGDNPLFVFRFSIRRQQGPGANIPEKRFKDALGKRKDHSGYDYPTG